MPILVLKPFMEIAITGEQEAKILSLLESQQEIIKVNKTTFHRSTFAYIKQGGLTQADLPNPVDPSRRLKADNRSEQEQYKSARKAAASVREVLKKRKIVKV